MLEIPREDLLQGRLLTRMKSLPTRLIFLHLQLIRDYNQWEGEHSFWSLSLRHVIPFSSEVSGNISSNLTDPNSLKASHLMLVLKGGVMKINLQCLPPYITTLYNKKIVVFSSIL